MAAPVIVTAVIVIFSLVNRGGSPAASPSAPFSESPAPPLPTTGWYIVHAVYAKPSHECLSIEPDNSINFTPTLTQVKCNPQDDLQRVWFMASKNSLYSIEAYDTQDVLKCVTVESAANRAPMHLQECSQTDRQQQFLVSVAGGTTQGIYRLLPMVTRDKGTCVGIASIAGMDGPQALQMKCSQTGIRGFSLEATGPPDFAR